MHMQYNLQSYYSLPRLHRASIHCETSKHGCCHRDRSDSVLTASHHRVTLPRLLVPRTSPHARLGLLEALDDSNAVDRTNGLATCMSSAHSIILAVYLDYCDPFLVPGVSVSLGHQVRSDAAWPQHIAQPATRSFTAHPLKGTAREIGTLGPSNDVDYSIRITLWLIARIAMEALDLFSPLHVSIVYLQSASFSSTSAHIIS